MIFWCLGGSRIALCWWCWIRRDERGSYGCTFCDGTRTRVFFFFFDPLLIKELTTTFIQTPGAVIMVITKTMKGKAAANSTCIFEMTQTLRLALANPSTQVSCTSDGSFRMFFPPSFSFGAVYTSH